MAITTFAAIDIGSYEVSMKIYELSRKYGMKEITYLRYRMDLGRDAYADGKISHELLEDLCEVIKAYVEAMKEYGVTEYRACATSALRELKNPHILIEQVYQKTGVKIDILSNAEQRFLSYKSIAAMEEDFKEVIKKGTAILDVGGGSTQVSLFDKDTLVSTQNLKLGILRIRERLRQMEKETVHYHQLVEEVIHSDIMSFKRLFLKDRDVKHVILLGDFFMDTLFHERSERKVMKREELEQRYEKIMKTPLDLLVDELEIPSEYGSLVIPTAVLYKEFIDAFGAEVMWAPGTVLADGIAYDYGEAHKIIKTSHNFENDILVAARNIGKRYNSSKSHVESVIKIALAMFDGMKKIHGMGRRERLLLQIAIQLHECGKYISVRNASECGYNIIKSTEIIGLSRAEQEIIANVVKYNNHLFDYFAEMNRETGIDAKNYLTIAKLTALLRVANELDRSHYQKIEDIKATLKGEHLVITVTSNANLLLETGLLKEKADFFEEIFGVRPVVKKRVTRR